MLKIKNNISKNRVKKKLLKLGFIESWDYIGMIKIADIYKFKNPQKSIKGTEIKIEICKQDNKEDIKFVSNTLYDLIQAGLVEKTGDRNY